MFLQNVLLYLIPTSGEISSIVNYKPTDGSFIPVEQKEVDSILTGNES